MKAVITGATSGIGRDMAEYLAKNKWNLFLTGRNKEELERLKSKYTSQYKISVETAILDLSDEDSTYRLYELCKDEKIDMLVNNAGFGVFGNFTESSLEKETNMIKVNVLSLHILMKLFLKKFEKQGSGIILNTASSAGFMAGPLMAGYYASKNYVVALTLAVNEELRRKKSKVKVCALCPGPVDTNFNNTAGVNFQIKPLSSDFVAKYGIDNALKGKTLIVPGVIMKASVVLSRFLPRKFLTSITYNVQKKKEK